MNSVRIEKTDKYNNLYNATIVKSMESGTIDKSYIRKEKQAEVEEYGFAYVNQPSERVI